MKCPLEGLLVLDLSQFLAGPVAALRLADLGARVIKIERPEVGELGRKLYLSDVVSGGDSTLFHSINRNKESFAADLKQRSDLEKVRQLIRRADVMIQNFRPGVIDRIGLGYESVREINPRIIYGSISGYGTEGPWRERPGQDLLAQAISGLPWLNGNFDDPPIPVGLAVADLLAGFHLVQGILACLVRRGVTGEGGIVEISLLEAILDAQFEVLTTYLNGGGLPQRGVACSAHAYLAAPYGLYPTADGHLALSMTSVPRLGELMGLPELAAYPDSRSCFEHRNKIRATLAGRLRASPTQHWLDILEPAGVWCAEVLTWDRLMQHEGFTAINMLQEVSHPSGVRLRTTRCPIRVDGQVLTSAKGAPRVGQDTERISQEFGLVPGEEKASKSSG